MISLSSRLLLCVRVCVCCTYVVGSMKSVYSLPQWRNGRCKVASRHDECMQRAAMKHDHCDDRDRFVALSSTPIPSLLYCYAAVAAAADALCIARNVLLYAGRTLLMENTGRI